ncbi:ribonuclease H [candidate division WWE3 bacterium CG10_big_fil_rev_8_21_14_0_10_35_32]|nr:MAG: ribonuclease H [candidate division WWE3 bacterium CG10_big_fil_rev_8_21_14_0_10_35_32]
MLMSETFSLNTDGGARGNPGPSAIGGVIKNSSGEIVNQFKEFTGVSTNNVAEYSALIKGLSVALELGIDSLNCFLDSELVVKQINGMYRVKDENLKLLFERVVNLKSKFSQISFNHVKRKENSLADKLVNEALDSNT